MEIRHPGYIPTEGLRHESDFAVPEFKKPISFEPIREESGEYIVYAGNSAASRIEALREAGKEAQAETLQIALNFCHAIKEAGGFALFVGGSVRDQLWGKEPKDIDIEVYGLEAPQIETIVDKFGRVDEVGKAFGILKLFVPSGDIDISLPRTDSKNDDGGHTGFDVKTDPTMSIKEAARRRDFTWNALSQDPISGEIFDPFQGVPDAQQHILRVTDPERFQDDPLRVMRAVQFVGRFGLRVEPTSESLMRSMIPRLKELPKERMGVEWQKLLMKSPKPFLGLQHMMEWGIISELYPQIDAMRHIPQEFDWHPEGDVWVHTMMVVDEAATIARDQGLSPEESYELILAALCHDMGKPDTTTIQEVRGTLRITSRGHEPAGAPLAASFLDAIGVSKELRNKITALVKEHIAPYSIFALKQSLEAAGKQTDTPLKGATRKLARRTAPATIDQLSRLVLADSRGRGPFPDPKAPEQFMLPFDDGIPEWLQSVARDIQVSSGKAASVIGGRDVLSLELGIKPGIIIGDTIRLADELRDRYGWDKETILTHIVDTYNATQDFATAIQIIHEQLQSEAIAELQSDEEDTRPN